MHYNHAIITICRSYTYIESWIDNNVIDLRYMYVARILKALLWNPMPRLYF